MAKVKGLRTNAVKDSSAYLGLAEYLGCHEFESNIAYISLLRALLAVSYNGRNCCIDFELPNRMRCRT